MAGSPKKVIYAALVGNFLVATTKFIAAGITGSSAMLSEGIHSIVDTGNQFLLLLGMQRSQKPADLLFPFGHGREIYFWSFVVAIMIFAVGAGISIYEGIRHMLHPIPMGKPLVNYLVLLLAMVFEGGALAVAVREFSKTKGDRGIIDAVRRGKDPTLFVVLFEDTAAMLGLLAASLGIFLTQVTGNPVFDGAASVVIGLILGGTAGWLAYETKGLLIGESADRRTVQGIHGVLEASQVIEQVNEILTMHMGPDDILVNVSVRFKDEISAAMVREEIEQLDKGIKRLYPRIKRVFIEAERGKGSETGR